MTEQRPPDRRRSLRFACRELDEIVLSDANGPLGLFRIADLSPTGMRLRLIVAGSCLGPAMDEDNNPRLRSGTTISVGSCSPSLKDFLLNRSLSFVWRKGAMFGARFDTPLSFSDKGASLPFVSL